MSFDSPESDKAFQITDDKKKDGKKKDGKKEKKEKGYMVFEEEESDGGLNDMKSPNKGKKGKPGFKFPASKNIFPKGGKEEKKDKESKKEEKEKKKHKSKDKKKPKRVTVVQTIELLDDEVQPIFGVPLVEAVERNKSHDGIELPAIFRECIDYIEEYGLECEGIYRISGVKSKVQHLKDCYNKGYPAHLEEHEPNIVASLLKLFLRDLPEPVLTSALMNRFEEASTIKNEAKLVEQFSKLISELPVCNRLLLSWMIVHMTHIIQHQKKNKMTLQNVSIVLSPTMQISHRVLNILFSKSSQLFQDTQIKKYVPPLKPATSRWSLELPEDTTALEEELAKQESLLNQLHSEVNVGKADADKEEQLWEVQRVVTHLKRKIKFARKTLEAAEKRKKDVELKLQATASKEQTESRKVEDRSKSEDRPKSEEKETDEVDTAVAAGEAAPQEEEAKEVESENEIDPDQEIDYKHNRLEDEDEIDYKHNRDDVDEEDEESYTEELPITASEKVEKPQESASKIPDPKPVEEEPRKTVTFETPRQGSSKKKQAPNPPLNTQTSIHEPLQPIKAVPVVPKKIEDSADEDRKRKRREELKALEIELLGLKQEEEEKQNMQGSDSNQEVGDENENDEEYQQLVQDEYALKLEQEEMMIISDELRQKIKTEEKEIERLHQEIQELQYLRHDSDLEDVSSSSDSSYDSDDDEDLEDILHQLIIENEELEKKNSEFCQKIHEERMICLSVKLQIRLLQQKQLGHSQSMEKEMIM